VPLKVYQHRIPIEVVTEDRLGHVKSRINTINEILDQLWSVAQSDQIVSLDEKAILENVQSNLETYRSLAAKLTKNEDISDVDLEKLYIFEKKIVQDASAKALVDGYISGEEGDLLQKLLDFFENLNQ
jgi:hypothetical protein